MGEDIARRRVLHQQPLLELSGREITRGRLQPIAIIDLVQKVADGGASLADVMLSAAINLLVFERFHERFRGGVIPRAALAGR